MTDKLRVVSVEPFLEPDEMVPVYDITMPDGGRFALGSGVVVSNSKRVSLLDVNALISHGATETVRDAALIRGQRNDEYRMQLMSGVTPPPPKTPMIWEKFVSQLKSAGINVIPDGPRLNIMAMTSKDIERMAGGRYLENGETVQFDKRLEPIRGGLFDKSLTGGHGGRQWAAVKLDEPYPSPVMEEPIRRVLGLTQKDFEAVLAGKKPIGDYGTGPKALEKALSSIDVDRELDAARHAYKHGRKSNKDAALRKVEYLKSAKRLNLHPSDWMTDVVPVLPPLFRPVSLMDSGNPLVNDANYLYKQLLETRDNRRKVANLVGDDETGDERLAVYKAMKAVVGLADPVHPKLVEKGVQGALASVFGSSPKLGTVQRKLIGSSVDNVGRGVIAPNPDFDMDTIGLPEDKAFDVFETFVARRLRRKGMPLTEALRHIRERTPLAKNELEAELEERPVLANRAPVLHKFGVLAFRPKLVAGSTIQLSPLIVKGFGADFDGDTMQFHAPTDPKAVEEAKDRMMPSKNLLYPSDLRSPIHVPGQEYIAGLYYASTAKSDKPTRTFRSKREALAAYERGELDASDSIEILE